MPNYDWSKFPKLGMYEYTPEEIAYWPMQAVDPKWKIPPKVSIQCLSVAACAMDGCTVSTGIGTTKSRYTRIHSSALSG